MTQQHGPLDVMRYSTSSSFEIVGPHGVNLALVNRQRSERRMDGQIVTHDGPLDEAEAFALARTFAAAPDLLAALAQYVKVVNDLYSDGIIPADALPSAYHDAERAADAAIAKAHGEQAEEAVK